MLGDDYQVQHAPWDETDGGALDSKYGFQCLQLFLLTALLEPTTYDVIIFNFGIHDVNYCGNWPEEFTAPTEYEKNLKEIKSLLLATGANVGYALTFFFVASSVGISKNRKAEIATRLGCPVALMITNVGDPTLSNFSFAPPVPSLSHP